MHALIFIAVAIIVLLLSVAIIAARQRTGSPAIGRATSGVESGVTLGSTRVMQHFAQSGTYDISGTDFFTTVSAGSGYIATFSNSDGRTATLTGPMLLPGGLEGTGWVSMTVVSA